MAGDVQHQLKQAHTIQKYDISTLERITKNLNQTKQMGAETLNTMQGQGERIRKLNNEVSQLSSTLTDVSKIHLRM